MPDHARGFETRHIHAGAVADHAGAPRAQTTSDVFGDTDLDAGLRAAKS